MTTKQVSVRLSATGGRQVRAELEGVGDAGARGFGRLTREMEAANQRLEGFWRKAGVASGAATAALATAAGAMMRSTAAAAAEITQFAQIANATPETFQRWSAASATVGIEQEKLADILKDVNDRVGDFLQTGGGPMADFFETIAPKVGVTAEQFARLSGPEALQLFMTSLERAGLSQQEMTFYLEAMASDATRLIPLLTNGGAEMTRLGERAAGLGVVLDRQTLAALQRAQMAFVGVGQVFEGLRNQIGAALAPAVTALAEGFVRLAETGGPINRALTMVLDNLGRLASYAATFASFLAGRWVLGVAAAALSVRGLATALVVLRGALIRTGIGALIVGAGELVYWFSRLVTGAGGFGAAMGLLRDVAVEVWDRIKMGAASAGARATAMFFDIKSDAASAMASAITSVVDFGNSAVNTFQGTFYAVQAVWNALPDVFARIGALAMNTLIEAMQSGLAGVTEAINTVLTLGGRRPEWAIAPPDLSDWMAVVPEAVDIGGRAAEGFARGFETNLLAVPDLGLEAIASEALSSANTYRQAAEDLAHGATAPLASWQALADAVTSAGNDGADALTDTEGSARRLTAALEDTEDQANRAGGAARQAGSDAAAGAEEAATGWRAVSAALADYARDAMDWGKGLGQTLVGAFRSAENAFREFVKTGKLDFRSLISSILADLALLAFKRGVLGPIANALAGVFGGGGLFAGIFHTGGMVGAGGPMRRVPALAFADAPRMHAGGWAGLRPDEVPAILQRGERVLSRREVSAGMASSGPQRLEISVQVEGARGNREIEEMVNAGVSGALQQYDRLVAPRTLARVSQDPRRRG